MTDESPEQTIRENLGLAVLVLHAAGHLDAATADKAYRRVIEIERDRSRTDKERTDAFTRAVAVNANLTPARG